MEDITPPSVNRQMLSLSPDEVDEIIRLFLDSRHIKQRFCLECHMWQCRAETLEGVVHFNVTVLPTGIEHQVIVEFRRVSGSSLIFGSIFREFKWNREGELMGTSQGIQSPYLPVPESNKAIEALRCWLSFDPIEAGSAIKCIDDPATASLPAFKLLRMEALREQEALEILNPPQVAEHNHLFHQIDDIIDSFSKSEK
jgi:hypothetical protein